MVNAIEEARQAGVLTRVQPTWGYYRQPNGWITCSPITDIEELNYRREGWEPLPQYGKVEMTSEYTADHPLEVLFMFGGVKELSVEQVIESGFWMKPPTVPSCGVPINQNHKRHRATCWVGATTLEFRQVPPETPRQFNCRFCSRPHPTEKARDQHESVMHTKEQGDIRTGSVLAEALIKGLNKSEAPPVQASVSPTGMPYLCGFCPEGFRSPVALGKHVKVTHKSTESAA